MSAMLSLKEYFIQYGSAIAFPLNYRLPLHHQESLIWVEEGDIDLFALELFAPACSAQQTAQTPLPAPAAQLLGALTYLTHIPPGALIFQFPGEVKTAKPLIIAMAHQDSQLRILPLTHLKERYAGALNCAELDYQVQRWIEHISGIMGDRSPPRYLIPLELDETQLLPAQHAFQAPKTHHAPATTWLHLTEGCIEIAGWPHLKLTAEDVCFYPITARNWFHTQTESRITSFRLNAILSNPLCLAGLKHLHTHLIDTLFLRKRLQEQTELTQINDQIDADACRLKESLEELSQPCLTDPPPFPLMGSHPIYRACQIIGNMLNLKFIPIQEGSYPSPESYLYHLCQSSHVGYRPVMLVDHWWKHTLGPLLGFQGEAQRPLSLLPLSQGGYAAVDPETGLTTPFHAKQFPELHPKAYVFYRSFPPAPSLSAGEVIQFTLKDQAADYGGVLFFAFLTLGLLSLIPLLTGELFGAVIANLDYLSFKQIGWGLTIMLLSALAFSLTGEYIGLRIQTVLDERLSCALWRRMLQLPLPFFNRYAPIDLFNRLELVSELRRLFGGVALRDATKIICSLIYLAPMFYYHSSLAWISLVFFAAGFIVPSLFICFRTPWMEQKLESSAQAGDKFMEIIRGLPAIRSYGCENRFFTNWERCFFQNKQMEWKLIELQNIITTAGSATLPFSLTAIYAYLLSSQTPNSTALLFNLGSFMGFYIAYLAFFSGISKLAELATGLASILPLWKRTALFFHTAPETLSTGRKPITLTGKLRVDNLSFRYAPGGPWVLKNVSLEARPGEFIGVVGPSGCGKSTLMRLLIGFEPAEMGAIYYDDQEIGSLDLEQMRRQMGIVLQKNAILENTIRENVIAGGVYNEEQVLQALSLAGFTEDLSAMPMGIHTLLINGGATLSGGQKQKILIARALIGQHRLLILDEATSALDNRSQQKISENLERLQATRIVIAHRPSTILRADRIYVMHQGEVVESGSFAELAAKKGLFSDLLLQPQRQQTHVV